MPQLGDIKRGFDCGMHNRNKYIWSACIDCGEERWVTFYKGGALSIKCRKCAALGRQNDLYKHASEHPSWKGGRHYSNGYVKVFLTKDDFFYPMTSKNKKRHHGNFVLEHRLVMAKHLGRCLQPFEIVHHKNGVRDDNRIENLELVCSLREHSINHSKGYRDGFRQGFYDGKNIKIQILEKRIAELENAGKN